MKNSDNFFTQFSQYIFDAIAEIFPDTADVYVHYAKDKAVCGKSLSLQQAADYLKGIMVVDSSNLLSITTNTLKSIYNGASHKSFPFVAEISHNVTKRFVLTLYPVRGENKLYATINEAEISKEFVSFRYRKSTLNFNPADIIYVGYGNHCVKIYTESGCTNMFNVSFNDAAELVLAYPNFARSYKNCIINMDKVVRLENDSFIMTNDDVIAIPKRRLKEIKNRYREYKNTK